MVSRESLSQLAASSYSFFVCLTLHVPIRLCKLVQLSNPVEILKSFLLSWYMEFTHRGSVTPRGAARKGRATWRKWFGKSLFYLAAVLQKPHQLREDAWSKPVGDPCVHAVFQEEAWLQHLENICGTHWTAYLRLSWISQCFQAPGTRCISRGYSTCGTCVSHAVAMRKLFGPKHLTTAEVATAGILSL